jgi:transcriptional regulator with XRE-family HTH domain
VASRIRLRRLQLAMSQEDLARALNVTFQQVQKYEKRLNRISAGRLQEIATALSVPLQSFFEGRSEEEAGDETLKLAQLMTSSEVVSLLQAIVSLKNPRIRHLMSELAVAITEEIAQDAHAPAGITHRSGQDR